MVLSHFSLNALAAGMPESTEAPAPKKKPYLVSLSLASATGLLIFGTNSNQHQT
jgi:hypothetical protein